LKGECLGTPGLLVSKKISQKNAFMIVETNEEEQNTAPPSSPSSPTKAATATTTAATTATTSSIQSQSSGPKDVYVLRKETLLFWN